MKKCLRGGPSRIQPSANRLLDRIKTGFYDDTRIRGFSSMRFKTLIGCMQSVSMIPTVKTSDRTFIMKCMIRYVYTRSSIDPYALIRLSDWIDSVFLVMYPTFFFEDLIHCDYLGKDPPIYPGFEIMRRSIADFSIFMHQKYVRRITRTSSYFIGSTGRDTKLINVYQRMWNEYKHCEKDPSRVHWSQPDPQLIQCISYALRSLSIVRVLLSAHDQCSVMRNNDWVLAWIAIIGSFTHESTKKCPMFHAVIQSVALCPILAAFQIVGGDKSRRSVYRHLVNVAKSARDKFVVLHDSKISPLDPDAYTTHTGYPCQFQRSHREKDTRGYVFVHVYRNGVPGYRVSKRFRIYMRFVDAGSRVYTSLFWKSIALPSMCMFEQHGPPSIRWDSGDTRCHSIYDGNSSIASTVHIPSVEVHTDERPYPECTPCHSCV